MKNKHSFDYSQVKFLVENPPLIYSKSINKVLDFFMPISTYFMDYVQKPLLTMMKYPGRILTNFLGMGTAETSKVIRFKD
ncbi:MAG: hypothetical protein ACTSVE_03810, partial [Candidatus Helarchaeota archaeon]